MPSTITPVQFSDAEKWLAAMSKPIRKDGERIYSRGSVPQLESYVRGTGWRAMVMGDTGRVRARVSWAEGWSSDCTCIARKNCEHTVALMLAGLASLGDSAPKLADGEEKPTAKGKTKTAATDKTPKPETNSAPPAKPKTARTFTEAWTARLNRPLTDDELPIARILDDLHRLCSYQLEVPLSFIEPLFSSRTGTPAARTDTVELWPHLPADPWQTWLYTAAFLRRSDQEIPAELAPVTDWAEVQKVVGNWEREMHLETWRDWLATGAQREMVHSLPHELRVTLTPSGMQLEWRKNAAGDFKPLPPAGYQALVSEALAGRLHFDDTSLTIWRAFYTGLGSAPARRFNDPDAPRILNTLLRTPDTAARVHGLNGLPLLRQTEPLTWLIEADESGAHVDYLFSLVLTDGSVPPPALAILDGDPSLYVTASRFYTAPPTASLPLTRSRPFPVRIPAETIETTDGLIFLEKLRVEPPARMAPRVRQYRLRPVFRCRIEENNWDQSERLIVEVLAENTPGEILEAYHKDGWHQIGERHNQNEDNLIVRKDRRSLTPVPELVENLKQLTWWGAGNYWHKPVNKKFAEQFTEWLGTLPTESTLVLDAMLASLREGPIRAEVKLEVEESGIDWFDIRIALDLPDTTLTKAEIKALLEARGGFVRLGKKGWRRLEFNLSAEEEAELADLGLSPMDLNEEKQHLHALQLAGKKATRRMLSAEHAELIERRAEEIRTRVQPDVPSEISASLRPYQISGFHYLAYLSSNHFGGILADDMGLGKTLQTLTWLSWIRANRHRTETGAGHIASLVVCPKSVVDNWRSETERFLPTLRLRVLPRGADGKALRTAWRECDVVVLNYAQARILETDITGLEWLAVILDEAQAIKNPDSSNARVASNLRCAHRLALSGTPIENRLLDLWSIMNFAMPGILGKRAAFSKTFDQRSDPLARRRLAARVRPFVLRRTKGEVAKDLPPRIEEDLVCELDGPQGILYQAELKRARAALLNIQTKAQLDSERFNVLTSLMRLRQICCHPALVGSKEKSENEDTPASAKLAALLDLLESLMEQGHKVLVFSQFVQMLELIKTEVVARGWKHFLLTGATEDRGALVSDFQHCEDPAVFMISLRAGGFGMNLTAASYVVLFDPWWNPAVEAQAIDRTHRIGQQHTVIAYRLVMKGTIEEKIRSLQRQKSALATDILGEEGFDRSLSIEDFRFLLGED